MNLREEFINKEPVNCENTTLKDIKNAVNKCLTEEDYTGKDEDVCPECNSPIEAKWSSVKCSNRNCNWWFCF